MIFFLSNNPVSNVFLHVCPDKTEIWAIYRYVFQFIFFHLQLQVKWSDDIYDLWFPETILTRDDKQSKLCKNIVILANKTWREILKLCWKTKYSLKMNLKINLWCGRNRTVKYICVYKKGKFKYCFHYLYPH